MEIEQMLIGEEQFSFLWEVVLRTSIMFLAVIASLSVLGKRGVKQLSVFELVIIISMGSAAGDPMFYKDVGLVTAFVVFATIVAFYKIVMYILNRSEKFERMVEGRPVYLIKGGRFCYQAFEREALGIDEFFAELRNYNISQLGQIRVAIMETNGNISVFFYEEKDVRWGLPILPEEYEQHYKKTEHSARHSCKHCGHTQHIDAGTELNCSVCGRDLWVVSSCERRVT